MLASGKKRFETQQYCKDGFHRILAIVKDLSSTEKLKTFKNIWELNWSYRNFPCELLPI